MNEIRGFVRLGADLTSVVTGAIQQTHRAVAGRVFDALGSGPAPVRALHDGITEAAYGSVRGGAAAVRGLADAAVMLPASRPLGGTQRGARVLGILYGLFGDRLDRDCDLALPMSVIVGGREIALDDRSLAAAFPAATGRVAVFVHGLCESDSSWRLATSDADGSILAPYGVRLASDLGITSLYVRYNSGLRVGANGAALDGLMAALVDGWPVPLEEASIVGHSMGGLVARSACHVATANGSPWLARLGHVVYLGVPHQGAPLERLVDRLTPIVGRFPEAALLAAILDQRSVGIRDLRYGTIVPGDTDESPEWRADDPSIPLVPTVRHHMVVATLSSRPTGVLARLIGDALVLVPSGSGPRVADEGVSPTVDAHHVGNTNHIRVLNHPEVYERLKAWLDG